MLSVVEVPPISSGSGLLEVTLLSWHFQSFSKLFKAFSPQKVALSDLKWPLLLSLVSWTRSWSRSPKLYGLYGSFRHSAQVRADCSQPPIHSFDRNLMRIMRFQGPCGRHGRMESPPKIQKDCLFFT